MNIKDSIVPLHTHTYQEGGILKIGQRIEAKDDRNHWIEAYVVDANNEQVKIHYKGYITKFDEWINRNATSCFRPYGRYKNTTNLNNYTTTNDNITTTSTTTSMVNNKSHPITKAKKFRVPKPNNSIM